MLRGDAEQAIYTIVELLASDPAAAERVENACNSLGLELWSGRDWKRAMLPLQTTTWWTAWRPRMVYSGLGTVMVSQH